MEAASLLIISLTKLSFVVCWLKVLSWLLTRILPALIYALVAQLPTEQWLEQIELSVAACSWMAVDNFFSSPSEDTPALPSDALGDNIDDPNKMVILGMLFRAGSSRYCASTSQ